MIRETHTIINNKTENGWNGKKYETVIHVSETVEKGMWEKKFGWEWEDPLWVLRFTHFS